MPFPVPPPARVVSLTCEHRREPLGIDVPAPRLSWMMLADGRDRRQTAYEIQVGSGPGKHDLWSSGKQDSDESVDIPYGGKRLTSGEQAFWQVKVWDETGRPTGWSPSAAFTTGILNPEDWRAKWIGAPPNDPDATDSTLLRRNFTVREGLVRALVFVTGLGQYELRLNGKKVGNDLLSPGWTNYRKTVLYDTYDVTSMLKNGANAAGILLGNGMDNVHGPRYTKFTGTFGPQRALAQIHLTYQDGATEVVATDNSWSARPGPITFSSVYGGEDYDYRLEPKGWDQPGFSLGEKPAAEMDGPGGQLRGGASAAPPLQTFETFRPRRKIELVDGAETLDLGQNASFMIRMRVSGPKGAQVRVIPAETIKPNGEVDRTSAGGGDAWWQVTLDGEPVTYFPKFFYQGCRYLQVECSGGAKVEWLEGLVVHAAAPEVGEFRSSSDLFNRIHTLIRWAQRSNLVSVLTDCPHRERLGWLEQYHLNGPSLRYEHDLSTLYAKAMQDMADSQLPSGLVPDIAPEYPIFSDGFRDSPEWGSAVVLVPWQQYLFHRDVSLLRDHYDTMKRYVEYLRSTAQEGIVDHGLGDWYDIGPGEPGFAKNTPIALTATAFYYEDVKILADVATMLGESQDATTLTLERESIKRAFNARFFHPAEGYYATDSQTANAIPLVMGLAPEDRRANVLAHLVQDIQRRGNAITAGDVGYRYLLRALADGGRSDVVFAMNNQSDKPGYGYQLKMGATSLTEAWDAHASSSQNHFMLGQIMEWLYHDLCGIQPADGFKSFVIHPAPVQGMDWAKASYRSDYGTIECEWRREGGAVSYAVSIPPNTHASLELPGLPSKTVGSGTYRFKVGG